MVLKSLHDHFDLTYAQESTLRLGAPKRWLVIYSGPQVGDVDALLKLGNRALRNLRWLQRLSLSGRESSAQVASIWGEREGRRLRVV